jgi:hypothetical protein
LPKRFPPAALAFLFSVGDRGTLIAAAGDMSNERRDEIELLGFARATAARGVQLVTAGDQASLAAAAVLGKALKRVGVPLTGLTVASAATRLDDAEALAAMREAAALLVVGGAVPGQLLIEGVRQFSVAAAAGEPICAVALRLAETIANADAGWVAALGLLDHRRPHAITQQALTRHTRDDLQRVVDLLDAAGRSPMPGMMCVMALELLIVAPDPRRFLAAEPSDLLRKCQAIVAGELVRAAHLRPRPGHAAVVIEYDSACRVEDLVAQRWRGLRPGTAVIVANHGWVEGRVAVVARSASPDALEPLRPTLGDAGEALLSLPAWADLLARLGVPPAPIVATAEPALDFAELLASTNAPLVS